MDAPAIADLTHPRPGIWPARYPLHYFLGALGGRSHLLQYQWVAKTCQTIRCISNAPDPFRNAAQGGGLSTGLFQRDRPVPQRDRGPRFILVHSPDGSRRLSLCLAFQALQGLATTDTDARHWSTFEKRRSGSQGLDGSRRGGRNCDKRAVAISPPGG